MGDLNAKTRTMVYMNNRQPTKSFAPKYRSNYFGN